jgi:hypothetical protein
MKYLIIMWLCSTVPGNECKQLPTEITEFKDHYDCAIYGYKHSVTTIESFDKDFINEYGVYSKFVCAKQEPKQETKQDI